MHHSCACADRAIRTAPETTLPATTPAAVSAATSTETPICTRRMGALAHVRRLAPHACRSCMQVVRHAQRNWAAFADDNPAVDLMSGHIMLYPIRVHQSGRISPRTNSGTFPDATGAYILPDKIAAPKFPSTLVT